jgi:DnaJ-domain-containing protein 1
MFERNVVQNGSRQKIPANLRLADDSLVSAMIFAPQGLKLIDLLNRQDGFIEAEMEDGSIVILAKHAVREVLPVGVARLAPLARGQRGEFDPHAVLGVMRGASAEMLRACYLDRVKQYHPDRFVGLNLPKEVEEYAASMLQRINAAYQFLNPRERAA